MERIHSLIDKLYEQKQQNQSPAQLLQTVQQLHLELGKEQPKSNTLGTAKVAVMLPANFKTGRKSGEGEGERETETERESLAQPSQLSQPSQPPPSTPQNKEYFLLKPDPEEIHFKEPEPASASNSYNPAFNIQPEPPTLSQHQREKELHEVIGQQTPSLNDRLKQERTEVVHNLKDTPIKDLRKGIGINDRFNFVNELFRGDEDMYERSIKTINNFNILSEAEYWINRELKFKLGWNDNKDAVQHFYQLVRRRFA